MILEIKMGHYKLKLKNDLSDNNLLENDKKKLKYIKSHQICQELVDKTDLGLLRIYVAYNLYFIYNRN